jgi:hypothetical protein
MTIDEPKTPATRHRSAAKIGAVAGLALLLVYLGYEYGMTPMVPDVQKATAAEVVAYISDSRGLSRQPQVEQQRFLERWRDLIMSDAAKKEELRTCFEKMDDLLRKDFSAEMFKHFKRSFLDDAKMYAAMPRESKSAFLRDKATQYRDRAVFLKDVAVGFGKQFKGTEDDMREWIMENTTAEERALGEPYAEALKKADEQIRKEQRGTPTTSPQTPAQGNP